MKPMLFKFPFDRTGTSVRNQVNRPVNLDHLASKPNRCFVVDEGYFFKKNLEIAEEAGRVLEEHVDYKLTGANADLMMRTGMDVVCVVVIINPKVSSNLRISVQLVGGPEGVAAAEIARLANQVLNTDREVLFNNLEDRPDRVRGSGHLHAMWELYKFEVFNVELAKIQAQIKAKSQKRYQAMRSQFDAKMAAIEAQVQAERDKLAAHIANTDDPHRITAAQVKLENVVNVGLATTNEASQAGTTVRQKYMTVGLGALSIQSNYIDKLNLHLKDFEDPHKDTAAKIGTMSYEEADEAFGVKYFVDETVANASKFDSKTYQQIYNAIRANLSIPMLSSLGRVPPIRLGTVSGAYNETKVLAGNEQYIDVPAMFSAYTPPTAKVVYLTGLWNFNNAVAQLTAVFADNTQYPEGTLAFFTVQNAHDGYTGNGTAYERVNTVNVAVKRSGSWVY